MMCLCFPLHPFQKANHLWFLENRHNHKNLQPHPNPELLGHYFLQKKLKHQQHQQQQQQQQQHQQQQQQVAAVADASE
jgi:hypothetical protein